MAAIGVTYKTRPQSKEGRAKGRPRGEEQRQGAEALRDNESPVDAFHTFRHLFVTGRLHYVLEDGVGLIP